MSMMKLSDYAKHRGCSPNEVQMALAVGRIKAVRSAIDSGEADTAWEPHTDPLQVPIERWQRNMDKVFLSSRVRILKVPSAIKERLPHLSQRDIAEIQLLIRGLQGLQEAECRALGLLKPVNAEVR